MHCIVYQTTNLINDKTYRGIHQSKNIDDGYLGSGHNIKRAIAKYGVENFKREVLYQFDNPEDMYAKEIELVTEDWCSLSNTYNICPGGQGGFGYIEQNKLSVKNFRNPETNKKAQHSAQAKLSELRANTEWLTLVNQKVSIGVRGYLANNNPHWLGKTHSEETKLKLSKSKNQGSKNSQFGSMWITNGTENKKIKKVDSIPEGWYKGRKI